ncbi:pilus assembly protein PilO [Sulfuricaulis limicola]|uniref:Pilus assembly protein PilO n=1 Tax=Sulfuricaulis limicola TaxID=1620215 RepID=A0A1B4XC31_9GAMM|nr:type 4a pilus biogenesis protein PilO [Sulfuricaulis limicola]BAV32384.1 pilus assembly protein PilO [Sulfuricaulis limicola]
MTLDDLKNIDVNNLSSWPVPIKIAGILFVCGVILFAGFWFLIQGELDEYGAAQKTEEGLRETYLNKKALAINLPVYREQMEEMEQTFGSLLRQLPNTTEVPDLLVDITQAGLGRGLEFALFRPEKELPKDFYAELPISIQVRGSYHELAQFVSDVAALPRIVTFGDINISSGKDSKLTMAAKAKTYRYLEGGSAPKSPAMKPRGRK